MKSSELREKYLEFFKSKGHKIIPSASLIPENDPTVLFTTAGMHPLVPYLLGQKHPEGTRLVNAQKCIRTGDIDDVGDDTHLTFFEMLGNWSLGDYWKDEAIKWSFEFLTKELKIPLERLAVTCFAGDKDAPKDEESAKIWESLGIKKERIAFLPKEDNWWGPAGKTGPCGPDTEMFYWKDNTDKAPKKFDPKDKNWVEIWNDVFMQYIKDENGNFNPALQKNVDTGMGLERTIAVLNGKENVYETDLFLPIIKKIEELSGKKYEDNKKAFRIIADHIKSISFLISEGIVPSNKAGERGSVLFNLIRDSYKVGLELGLKPEKDFDDLTEIVKDIYKNTGYLDAKLESRDVKKYVIKEEQRIEKIMETGISDTSTAMSESDYDPYTWYSTSGVPYPILEEEWRKRHGDTEGFRLRFEEGKRRHQELSRTASAGMFKGGLADNSEETTKLHTAAHLMLAGLRKVLGDDVFQKGSNITAERLRFDFSHKEKMTSEQIEDVENFVNDIIKKDLPVLIEQMPIEKAKETGAMGIFESKYGQMVKIYTIKDKENIVSREICGGPHVEHTGVLGHFKIQKEESSSSGVRRIKAVLENF